jgi:hypothetical protein
MLLPGGMRVRLSAIAAYRYNEEKAETRIWLLGDVSPVTVPKNIVARLDRLLGAESLERIE